MSLLSAPPAIVAFMRDVFVEFERIAERHGASFHSPHEGWAEILEEVDELWEEVRRKTSNRDPRAMRAECVQIAARALKFALSFGKEPK